MKWNVGAKIGAGFLLALLILFVMGILVYRNTQSLVVIFEMRRRSFLAVQSAERVLSLVKDAETGQRGYVITGQDRYLEPHEIALNSIDEQLKTLRELISADVDQQQRFE